jgi:hypothetical protein
LRRPWRYQRLGPMLDALALNHEGIAYYANSVIKSEIFQLARRDQEDRYLHLVAFIAHQYYRLQDNLVDTGHVCHAKEHECYFELARQQLPAGKPPGARHSAQRGSSRRKTGSCELYPGEPKQSATHVCQLSPKEFGLIIPKRSRIPITNQTDYRIQRPNNVLSTPAVGIDSSLG